MNVTDQQTEFITVATLSTLTGASLAVMLTANVAQYVFDWSPRWFGLLISGLISIGLMYSAGHATAMDWAVCTVRAFQIYATAVGLATITGRKPLRHSVANPLHGQSDRPRTFLSSWF
jgi:hypothetical protein